jgi:hypothetical protein
MPNKATEPICDKGQSVLTPVSCLDHATYYREQPRILCTQPVSDIFLVVLVLSCRSWLLTLCSLVVLC